MHVFRVLDYTAGCSPSDPSRRPLAGTELQNMERPMDPQDTRRVLIIWTGYADEVSTKIGQASDLDAQRYDFAAAWPAGYGFALCAG